MKRAYVLYAVGQRYIDRAKPLIDFLFRNSKYNVFLCYAEGTVSYSHERLTSIPIEIEYRIDFTKLGRHDPNAVRPIYITLYKPDVVLRILENYDVDECVYLDSDIVPIKNVDIIFDRYSSECTNYPLLTKFPFRDTFCEGRPLILDKMLNFMRVSRNIRSIGSLSSCIFMANKQCISFLKTWSHIAHDDQYGRIFTDERAIVEDNDIAHWSDEPIANMLIWKMGATKSLHIMTWTDVSDGVLYTLNQYNSMTDEFYTNPDYSDCFILPPKYAGSYVINASFTKSKSDFLGFHAIKDPEEFRKSLMYMEQLY
jgi:hypothetical protein